MSKAAGIRFIAAALAAAATLVVFGCGGDSATETASAPDPNTAQGGESEAPIAPDSSAAAGLAHKKGVEASEEGAAPTAGKQGPSITPPKGPQEREPSAKERAEATVVSMSLSSPALGPGPESVSLLPSIFTCDGKNTWPALQWSGAPPGTAELILFVLNLEPVNEALFFDWALAGLDPGLTGLKSGSLPKGVVVGRNGFGREGYSICPAKSPETVIFALYALPEKLPASEGFDPAALRKEVLDTSGNAGLLATSYSRG